MDVEQFRRHDMKSIHVGLFVFVLLVLVAPAVLSADPIHYDFAFSGDVINGGCALCGPLGFDAAVGSTITGTFGYDVGGPGYINVNIGSQSFSVLANFSAAIIAGSPIVVSAVGFIPQINTSVYLFQWTTLADLQCSPNLAANCFGVLPGSYASKGGSGVLQFRDGQALPNFNAPLQPPLSQSTHYLNALTTASTSAVPEPGTFVLTGAGFLLTLLFVRRRTA
jgi:hypothetical protein